MLGMYTKYDTGFLALSVVGVLLLLPGTRPKLRTAGPYLMVATALGLFAPHIVWLVSEHFPTIQYILDRSQHAGGLKDHVINPVVFLLSQTTAILPTVLILWPVFGWKWKWRNLPASADSSATLPWSWPWGQSLCTCSCRWSPGPRCTPDGAAAVDVWPLLFLTCFERSTETVTLRRALFATVVIALAFPLGFGFHRLVSPYVMHRADHVNFPGKALATAVEKAWQAEHSTPMPWIGGEWWVAGNAAFYARQCPRLRRFGSPRHPRRQRQAIPRTGGMLVWYQPADHPEPPAEWQQRFPGMRILPPVEIPYQTTAHLPLAHFGLAVVPARSSQFTASASDRTAQQPLRGPQMR